MTDLQVISITIMAVVLIICSTIMALAKLKVEANPLNKLFSSNKKDEERKDGRQ